MGVLVALCTAPDEQTATDLARRLVEEKLAACVNIIGPVRSIYRWDGRIEDEAELQLAIKSHASRADALTAWIGKNHPYDEPELLFLPVEGGAPGYLAWVAAQCAPSGPSE